MSNRPRAPTILHSAKNEQATNRPRSNATVHNAAQSPIQNRPRSNANVNHPIDGPIQNRPRSDATNKNPNQSPIQNRPRSQGVTHQQRARANAMHVSHKNMQHQSPDELRNKTMDDVQQSLGKNRAPVLGNGPNRDISAIMQGPEMRETVYKDEYNKNSTLKKVGMAIGKVAKDQTSKENLMKQGVDKFVPLGSNMVAGYELGKAQKNKRELKSNMDKVSDSLRSPFDAEIQRESHNQKTAAFGVKDPTPFGAASKLYGFLGGPQDNSSKHREDMADFESKLNSAPDNKDSYKQDQAKRKEIANKQDNSIAHVTREDADANKAFRDKVMAQVNNPGKPDFLQSPQKSITAAGDLMRPEIKPKDEPVTDKRPALKPSDVKKMDNSMRVLNRAKKQD